MMNSENLGGGQPAKPDRFTDQLGYRSPRRESGSGGGHDLPKPTNGAGPQAEPAERRRQPLDRRRDQAGRPTLDLDVDGLVSPAGHTPQPDRAGRGAAEAPGTHGAPAGWPVAEGSGPVADHPLVQGLLLELPPRGATPPDGWLDRWFEAARCVLELIYLRGGTVPPR